MGKGLLFSLSLRGKGKFIRKGDEFFIERLENQSETMYNNGSKEKYEGDSP
jgi:hypothetical protein